MIHPLIYIHLHVLCTQKSDQTPFTTLLLNPGENPDYYEEISIGKEQLATVNVYKSLRNQYIHVQYS